MNKIKKKGKVFVGMSGGVDSSVAAALLKQRGYEVVGVFIKIWDPAEEWGIKCTWREERRDAMRVAARLDIPLLTLDLTREYKRGVVDYMIREYRAGRTPNPDVMCNRQIKFGAFFRWARRHGADYVATGHYVRIRPTPQPLPEGEGRNAEPSPSGRAGWGELLTACDLAKDQSYFLWTLTQAELKHCLFPIGDYQKSAVRKLAKKFNLPTAEKKDSQGLCFIGDWNLKDFLRRYIKPKRGRVLSETGEVIGTHEGAAFFTIGERHGFTVDKKTPDDRPYYVIGKDVAGNTLTISSAPTTYNQPSGLIIVLSNLNWLSGHAPDLAKTYRARCRYRAPLETCRLELVGRGRKKIQVIFQQTSGVAAAGQSCVIYDGQIMLGGGVIDGGY